MGQQGREMTTALITFTLAILAWSVLIAELAKDLRYPSVL